MPRLRRASAPTVPFLLLCLIAVLAACRAAGVPPVAAPTDDPRQIHWQRSLADALLLANEQHLPLLLAVNMDGESASDRIVHEEYHDPAFVAASRHYVCLVASVFRHNPRDYDERGNRIPCPRLGWCTCGEHIALEPLLHDRFLADGERVAPRHAVIGVDGRKQWDLSLSFDLQDIDRAVLGGAAAAALQEPAPATDWTALASARDAAGRARCERALAAADAAGVAAALSAIATHGDAGSLDALRLVIAQLPALGEGTFARFVAAVQALSLGGAAGAALRDAIGGCGHCGAAVPGVGALEAALRAIDGGSDASKALLLARHGAFAIDDLLVAAAATRAAAGSAAPLAGGPTDAMASAEELTQQLNALDAELHDRRDDAALRARYAKASLDLARRHMETKEKDVAVLLADAEQSFGRALQTDPAHADWWIERARTAYFDQRYADEAAHGHRALQAALGRDLAGLPPQVPVADPLAVEALRWIADGEARRYPTLLAGDEAVAGAAIGNALRAFAAVAASVAGAEDDWTSFTSFCSSLGMWREQFLAARAAALRFPAARGIRQELNAALWAAGRADDVVAVADGIVAAIGDQHPARADAAWFAGYAAMLLAENERRAVRNDAARADYAVARERFAAAIAARPDYRDGCATMIALTHLGDGLAAVRDGRRAQGADDLVLAVRSAPKLAGLGDGLGYDVLDLVDKIGEWRADGASPVDVLQLAQRLDELVSEDPFYVVALADSQLREALRADGRNPVRVERDTVDASGNPIRMRMGVPNDEGDGYLRTALQLLRPRANRLVAAEDRKVLAQCDTIWAERQFERGRDDGVEAALREAATLLGQAVPTGSADEAVLRRLAGELRQRLGDARPRWREGR